MSFRKVQLKRLERLLGKKAAKKLQAEIAEELRMKKIIRQFKYGATPKDQRSYH